MNDVEQRKAAKDFAEYWKDKGSEKSQSQSFWIMLLEKVYGVDNPVGYITFEDKVFLDNASFIDGYIADTKVLIEQKSIGKSLTKPIRQSDGTLLTPFQQAKRYITELPVSKHPRWVITCNFESFLIYDMEQPGGDPEEILLKDLEKEYYRLEFMVNKNNERVSKEVAVSKKAGDIVGYIYDALAKQYINPNDKYTMHSLNVLCVRLVFCLYAEDAGIFGRRNMFHDYLSNIEAKHIRKALIELFDVLDTKEEDRDPYIDDELAEFPYVNGGLFASEQIEIPNFTEELKELILIKASENFDWSEISPTIFGAVFESTLNPETRHSGGMHYTSIENIHKVIEPLFLDDLKNEFKEIDNIKTIKTKREKLEQFQVKLSKLKWLDPACGSGNFLTETFISIRKLENKVILELIGLEKGQIGGQMVLGNALNPIKVSINQFYGIEINDFAVTVAKTAMWIAESQMMKETEDIIHMKLDFLPLKSYVNIIEGNALRLEWNDVISKYELNYIMGNPPFLGARLMKKEQKEDLLSCFEDKKGIGNLDYVTGWYKKAFNYIENTQIHVAFVSTNSISQGEQPALLWADLLSNGLHITFAHRTFRWDSEASLKAKVHCVIIGFSYSAVKKKMIFQNDQMRFAKNINAYLIDAPNVFVINRRKPLCNVPEINFGSMPNDGGELSNFSYEKMSELIKKFPTAKKLFKKFLGSEEFINNKNRYCLWLKDIEPNVIKEIPPILTAIKTVKEKRENSTRVSTQKLALTPHLFGEIRQPETDYLLIPSTSSENRMYIPIGYMNKDVIASNACFTLSDASLYHFGVLISNVHMAWVKTVCGRLKSDYRYSGTIVYNNFPWCNPTLEQKKRIEQTAQAILDARAKYKNSSLADLYGETMYLYPELLKAHQANDKAVMEAYGFWGKLNSKLECVTELMKMYQKLVSR